MCNTVERKRARIEKVRERRSRDGARDCVQDGAGGVARMKHGEIRGKSRGLDKG
jgi:hypothetical protein